MKHLHCTTCGKEKLTYSAQKKALCGSCVSKGKRHSQSLETREKISATLTGKKRGTFSEETCRKMSIAQGGLGENRKWPGLKKWCRLVKERDGECVHCHSKDQLEAHHLLRKAKFPQFATELWNGLTLCRPCHIITHSKVGIT